MSTSLKKRIHLLLLLNERCDERIQYLDGVRFIAISCVVIFHALRMNSTLYAPNFVRAYTVAIIPFFIWLFFGSGLLIGTFLNKELKKNDTINIPVFYIRRALRIWPAYLAALLYWFISAKFNINPSIWRFLTFTQNFTKTGYFEESWTVAVEEQFYLCAPFIAYGMIKWPRYFLPTCLISSFLARWYFDINNSNLQNHTLRWSDILVIGSVMGIVSHPLGARFRHWLARTPNFAFWIGLSLYLTGGAFHETIPALWPLLAAISALLMFAPVMKSGHWINRFFSSPQWRPFAQVSYSLYLVHLIVFPTMEKLVPQYANGPILGIGVAYVASVFVAFISFIVIERPFLIMRRVWFPPRDLTRAP